MRARRTDANHVEIKRAFEKLGCAVVDLSNVGGGVPDLLVAKSGNMVLVEVKTPSGKTNKAQKAFWLGWKGMIRLVRNTDDVREVAECLCNVLPGLKLKEKADPKKTLITT